MTASKREREAIVAFLSETKHAREVKRRLFDRVAEEPDVVLLYLDSLPEGTEAGDELLQQLRKAANIATSGSKGGD
ncbi:MAG: hypothetical protein ACR2PS_05215 [Pseudomonadales bacterium]